MISVAITGQIASGKSTLAKQFESLGAVRFDADKAVHRLLASGGKAVCDVAAIFPETLSDNAIDRAKLGQSVFSNAAAPNALKTLEAILHPLVYEAELTARRMAKLKYNTSFFVSEVPLLFESEQPNDYDLIIVAYVSPSIQKARVMARRGMTNATLEAILARQMPLREQLAQADISVNTGLGKVHTLRAVKQIMGQ